MILLKRQLQKQALALYREALRTARTKPQEGRAGIEALARTEFDKYRAIARKDFNRIEHLLRRGKRQIDVLKQADVAGVQLMKPQEPPK